MTQTPETCVMLRHLRHHPVTQPPGRDTPPALPSHTKPQARSLGDAFDAVTQKSTLRTGARGWVVWGVAGVVRYRYPFPLL